MRDDACVCRFGGDEFAVLLPGANADDAQRCAERAYRAHAEPLRLHDVMLSADASIGIALAPAHGNDSESLLRHADVAMYAAKAAHRRIEIYTAQSDHHTASRLAMVSELKQAIAENQLALHYQPKAELADGAVRSVEALVRWDHPVRGVIPPDEFIGVAEQTGLIGGLTDWVLLTALRQQRAWSDSGLDLNVAINISPRLLDDESFPATLTHALSACRVRPDRVTLEITENAIMANPEHVIEMLEHLRRLGLTLSMDDFGIGHSSMAYLKRLPIHEVKIDKLFVRGMLVDPDDQAIVHAIVELAHRLRLQVVAEGVETAPCWQRLAQMKVDTAQGYLLGKPMRAQELTAWYDLRQTRSRKRQPRARNPVTVAS
jgi:predicted signal transduction protein with EAL and GGDEF domain